ncbi:glycosyltransferase [Algibacter sp. PT7-4]|uniref:glycosyltransferase n=1 Tax=Algibacter ulvanivorans TaxID=3400999 RepID=UPI003AAB8080
MNPKISIIVPVYNAEKYIAKCIESILDQTYRNLEVILINDGSKDNSLAICNTYKNIDSRIIIINQENEGTSSARNKGLEIATGNYIGFVDGDDVIEKEMYEILILSILKHNLKFVECDFIKSNTYKQFKFDEIRTVIQSKDEAISRIEKPGFYNVWTKLFEAKLLKNIRFAYGKIHQDALFVSEVYKSIEKIGYVKVPLYIYTSDNESITRTNYNIKKVQGIDVILETNSNLMEVTNNKKNKVLLNKILIKYLVFNYVQLYNNSNLDKDIYYRKKIKQIIKKKATIKDFNFYVLLIKFFPTKFYEIFHKVNTYRINKFN